MRFPRRQLEAIAAGSVTLAFRRWDRARVKPGARLRTAVGVVAIDDVRVVAGGSSGRPEPGWSHRT